MSDAVEALRSEVEEMRRTGRTPAEVVLDLSLTHADPGVAQAIWYCAIPRWFNLELIKALRPRHSAAPSPQGLLDELLKLPYIKEYQPFGYAYQEHARNHLLERWRTDNYASFVAWNRRAQTYFEGRLQTTTTSRLLGSAPQGAAMLGEAERIQLQRELMYHRLVVDPETGFQEFQDLFRRAERNRQFSEMRALLTEVKAQAAYLSGYRQHYLDYYGGVLDLRTGRLDEAQRTFLTLLADTGPLRLRSKLSYRMGELAVSRDQYEEAIDWFQRSLELCKLADCHTWEIARVLRDLGSAFQERGDWRQAETFYRRSLEEWQRINDQLGVVETFNDLGTLYLSQQKPNRALRCYQESLARLQGSPDEWRIARIYNNLGNYYGGEKQWDQALEYFNRSLEVKSRQGDTFGVGATHYNLANVFLEQGKQQGITQPLSKKTEALLALAVEHYELGLQAFRRVGDRPIIAQSLYYLASTYRALGKREQALRCIDEAIALYRSLHSSEVTRAEELRAKLLAGA